VLCVEGLTTLVCRPESGRVGRFAALLCAVGFLSGSSISLRAGRADNLPFSDAVGTIEGEAISVQGPMSVDTTNGQVKTLLRSGSEVQVKSGVARIDLVEGGNITIRGPAHFSLLKSGGALTIALDSGTIHAHIEGKPTLTVYTAQIQAHPIAIGDGPQDVLVGLAANGRMCILAGAGAVRLEQQLSGQSLVIPQSGDVSLTDGRLESLQTTAGRCSCTLQMSPIPSGVSTEISALASTEELRRKAAEAKPASPPPAPPQTDGPIYQVFMPPLHYDANAKVQKDYDPNLIVLVRRARVRPALIFRGRVAGDPVVAQVTPPAGGPKQIAASQKPADDSPWNRVRTFFRKLWSPSS
jgi:hypothetical protein